MCDLQGDSVDFTGRLLGLEPMAAVERLNIDFGLNLPLHRKATKEDEQAAQRRQEVAEAHSVMCPGILSKPCALLSLSAISLEKGGWCQMTEAEMLERIHTQGKFLSLNEENTKLVRQKIRELIVEQEIREEVTENG